jgi:hypothetical protein
MFLASEPLAVLDLHHLSGSWMERIEDSHVERRTPGIVTLVRAAPARVGLPVRSATRRAATIDPSSIIASQDCSMRSHSHEATAVMRGSSKAWRVSIY